MSPSNVQQPLVSVCIPTYNRAERLRRAVDSALRSTYGNLEILISDNASVDRTPQVCEELARQDPRIRWTRQPVNLGATANFIFLREQAKGKYFHWLADDDYIDADYIAACVAELERDPSLVLAAGLGAYHGSDGTPRHRGNVVQADGAWALWRVLRYIFLVEDNSIFYGLYRREAVGRCRVRNWFGGDAVWVAETLLEGGGRVLPQVKLHREDDAGGASMSPARIASSLGLPPWMGRYPWLALPLSLARGVAGDSDRMRRKNPLARLWAFGAIFLVSFAKQLLQAVLRRVPRGRTLYKRLFRSESGI